MPARIIQTQQPCCVADKAGIVVLTTSCALKSHTDILYTRQVLITQQIKKHLHGNTDLDTKDMPRFTLG
jgi:hypothetical protein